ncbi:hypothetical protein MDIS_01130 [Mesomycoplasma dispar]|nr:hypothetical protein MDIS_01130 [Mesomycoplasma dispar]
MEEKLLEKINEKLENSAYIFINKSKFVSTRNIDSDVSYSDESLKEILKRKEPQAVPFIDMVQFVGRLDDYYNNAIEDLIALQYKKDDNIYHLYLDEIRNATFIVKSLEKYSFYEEKIKKFIDANWSKDVDFNDIFSKKITNIQENWQGWSKVVIALEDFENPAKCQYSIAFPKDLTHGFSSLEKRKEVEDLIIKEIEELIPFAKPKNIENHQEKIFDFLTNRYQYNSKFFEKNKSYLGEKVEKQLEKIRKTGLKNKYKLAYNVRTLEIYEIILQKFAKYNIKKVNLNIENREKYILSWLDKFGQEYKQHCYELFGKKGIEYFNDLNLWTNKLEFFYLLQMFFGPEHTLIDEYLANPDWLIVPSWVMLNKEKFEIFYFGGSEYGIHQEIIEQIDSKKPTFWLNNQYSHCVTGDTLWVPQLALHNFIFLYHDGENIFYWIGITPFYDLVYLGKYESLRIYYKNMIYELEKDIFLREGTEPKLFPAGLHGDSWLYSNEYHTRKDVIKGSKQEFEKLTKAINLYEKKYKKEYKTFDLFIKRSGLYSLKEQDLILKNDVFNEIYNSNKTIENWLTVIEEKIKDFDFRAIYKKKLYDCD